MSAAGNSESGPDMRTGDRQVGASCISSRRPSGVEVPGTVWESLLVSLWPSYQMIGHHNGRYPSCCVVQERESHPFLGLLCLVSSST